MGSFLLFFLLKSTFREAEFLGNDDLLFGLFFLFFCQFWTESNCVDNLSVTFLSPNFLALMLRNCKRNSLMLIAIILSI